MSHEPWAGGGKAEYHRESNERGSSRRSLASPAGSARSAPERAAARSPTPLPGRLPGRPS